MLFLLLTQAVAAGAQARRQPVGRNEIGILSGGGPAILGGVGDRGFSFVAMRYARRLTGDLGRGWYRGQLHYGIEVMPLYLQFQSDTVYGAGVSPFLVRYSFTRPQALAPYIEVGGGLLGTVEKVPENTSRFNFTPQGGIGVQVWLSGHRSWTAGVRYHHTSNAGLATRNPGINAIVIHTGVSWHR